VADAAPECPALEVDNLYYSYKKRRALNGVSFAVRQRSIHGFVGPNGAGKTTALKVLATLLRPQYGSARVFGMDLARDYRRIRARIGFMPDHFSTYRQMTVFEYLDFFGAAYGMSAPERERVIRDVLDLTDLAGRNNDMVKGLSRGMQQRLSLARVLVHDPDLLLLDEPASGLDPRARIELMEILRELRAMGKTIFISSHILSELAELCDSFTIIDRGLTRYTGPKRDLLNRVGAGEQAGYLLTLAAEHPAAEEAVRALDGVLGIDREEGDGTTLRVRAGNDDSLPNAILQAVIAAGGQVIAFRGDAAHLNQAFMDLTEPGVPS